MAGFCAHHIHFRARDAGLAPKKSWQLFSITALVLAAAVMWTTSPTPQILGPARHLPHLVYDMELTDGNERPPNGRISAPGMSRSQGKRRIDICRLFLS